eukprot:ANDGO_05412.mRNA.1 hypothetical protein
MTSFRQFFVVSSGALAGAAIGFYYVDKYRESYQIELNARAIREAERRLREEQSRPDDSAGKTSQ